MFDSAFLSFHFQYGYLQDPPGVDLVDIESTESTQNDSKIEEVKPRNEMFHNRSELLKSVNVKNLLRLSMDGVFDGASIVK